MKASASLSPKGSGEGESLGGESLGGEGLGGEGLGGEGSVDEVSTHKLLATTSAA